MGVTTDLRIEYEYSPLHSSLFAVNDGAVRIPPAGGAVASGRVRPSADAAIILYKLHARDRAQPVMLAYESGMVVPGS